jgi:hypothetical protein
MRLDEKKRVWCSEWVRAQAKAMGLEVLWWCAPLGLTILMSLIVIMLRTNRLICTMAGPSGTTHTTNVLG